jgi:hypothetical protein
MKLKELEMLRNRVFNSLIAMALVVIVALTAQEAFATTDVVSQANADHRTSTSACAILPTHLSIQTEYVSEKGMWVTYTAQGPSGVDGGLMALLSSYPTCSR